MVIEKSYDFSSFPNAKCHALRFVKEIRTAIADPGNALTTALVSLLTDDKGVSGRQIHCDFISALTTAEKTALDALRDAHQGVLLKRRFHGGISIAQGPISITSDAPWQTLGGIVSRLRFFTPHVFNTFGRITADIKTVGTTAQLQLIGDDRGGGAPPAEVALTSAPEALPGTASVWQKIRFDTDVAPRALECVYRLEGRLNGATSAEIRFCSLSLLETVTQNGES